MHIKSEDINLNYRKEHLWKKECLLHKQTYSHTKNIKKKSLNIFVKFKYEPYSYEIELLNNQYTKKDNFSSHTA